MKKLLLPIFVLFFFILESLFVELFSPQLFNSDRIIVPHFLLVVLLFLTVYGGKKQGILYAAIFGLLFDIVYTEVIGIYFFLYPLIAYFVSKTMQLIHNHLVVVSLTSMVGIILLELGVYELNFLIKVTEMDFQTFLQVRLYPTLILNLAFTILVSFPLKRQFDKYAEELRNE